MKPYSPYAIACFNRLFGNKTLSREEVDAAPEAERNLLRRMQTAKPRERQSILIGHIVGTGRAEEATQVAIRAVLDDDPLPDPQDGQEPAAKKFDFDTYSAADLDLAEFPREYLIEGVLVHLQPCLVGGPKKALKTSFMIALALALASGRHFLGRFRVPNPKRVFFLSGESGKATTQETLRRVARSMNVNLAGLGDRLKFGFRLPSLGVAQHMAALADEIREHGSDVVIIDPLYLCLLSSGIDIDTKNIFQMGPLLATISQICLDAGATPVLIHHFKKSAPDYKTPPELGDFSYVGVAEFARQWILIDRNEAYESGSGFHKLWLVYGGSAGHGGSWIAHVNEGVADKNFEGRTWSVELFPPSEARSLSKGNRREEEKERTTLQLAEEMVVHLRSRGEILTRKKLAELIKTSGAKIKEVADLALRLGWVREVGTRVRSGGGWKNADGLEYVEQITIPFSDPPPPPKLVPGVNREHTGSEPRSRNESVPGIVPGGGGPYKGPLPNSRYGVPDAGRPGKPSAGFSPGTTGGA